MRRYSALPAICLALFFLNLPFNAMAQDAGPQPTDVVYLLPDATLATYVINRATGIPALKGLTTLDVTGFTTIVPSPDDHFLYIFGFDPISGNSQLLVYPTDRDGVPRTRPIQRIDFPYLPFRIDPNMRYAYVVDYDDKALEWNFLQFPINPRTGMVQAPRLVAQESQYGPCSQWVPGAPAINGFSPTGDQLYEEWSCSSIEDTEFYYYTRQVDPRTGALSDAFSTVQTFGNGGGTISVNMSPNAILEFDTYDCCSLAVLPLSGGTPLFTCTGEMLQEC